MGGLLLYLEFVDLCQHAFHRGGDKKGQIVNGLLLLLFFIIFSPIDQHTGQCFGVKPGGIIFEIRRKRKAGTRLGLVNYRGDDFNEIFIKNRFISSRLAESRTQLAIKSFLCT